MPSRPTAELLETLRRSKRELHSSQRELALPEKIRQVLALQRIDYAVRGARGQLQWWEKPWEIDP